jgi:hypothetical protein
MAMDNFTSPFGSERVVTGDVLRALINEDDERSQLIVILQNLQNHTEWSRRLNCALPLTNNVLPMQGSKRGEQQEREYKFSPKQKTTSMAP